MRLYVTKTTGVVIFFALFVAASLVLAVFYQRFGGRTLVNPQEKLRPLGKVLVQNPNTQNVSSEENKKNTKNKLTIIFYYDGYESQEKALLDIEVLKKGIELVEPFNSLSSYISYEVFTSDESKCKVDEATQYLICDKGLIESFRTLGTDKFKVVLLSQKNFVSAAEKARGKNSWISITANPANLDEGKRKEWLGLMVTRLLGYSLGLSYETGTKTLEPTIPVEALSKSLSFSGKPNCAKDLDTAEKWWGSYVSSSSAVGYFQGCGGHKDYYFPQEYTLMSFEPKKETYGEVSEDYLRGVLSCFYGGEEKIVFPAGYKNKAENLTSCDNFKKDFPNFWVE